MDWGLIVGDENDEASRLAAGQMDLTKLETIFARLGILQPAASPKYLVNLLTATIPGVYTFGMDKYAVINLKTDPKLKKLATETANKLGISISAVLNNELRRFAAEQSVVFDVPEVPNTQTAKQLATSKKRIDAGKYHRFENNKKASRFLADELK